MAAVHKWVDSFNSGDTKTMASMCTDDAVVIDDFAPHVWQGGAACANWAKDYYTYKVSGKPTKDGGMVTMILHKTGGAWRIKGWAWADQ